jgi:hypothetical protein
MPDVKVREPPVRMISCLSKASYVSNAYTGCVFHTFPHDDCTPELDVEKMFYFIEFEVL